jgi:hypothetical protein
MNQPLPPLGHKDLKPCGILLKVFSHYAGINQQQVMREKLDVLWDRNSSASQGGPLFRPGSIEVMTESAPCVGHSKPLAAAVAK